MDAKTFNHYISDNKKPIGSSFKKTTKNMVEVFHENTKQNPTMSPLTLESILKHLFEPNQIFLNSRNHKNYFVKPTLDLPEPNPITKTFDELSNERSSGRDFKGVPLSDQDLIDLLASLKVTRRSVSSANKKAKLSHRTYASAGALYPVEIYALRPNENYTNWEAYHYDPKSHITTVVNSSISNYEIEEGIQNYDNFAETLGAIVVLTGVFDRSIDKYGAVGYRFALLEAGGILQQLGLAAAGLNLEGLAWGGSYDNAINKILEIDGVDESLISCFIVGKK